jgi:hypothetical protein
MFETERNRCVPSFLTDTAVARVGRVAIPETLKDNHA